MKRKKKKGENNKKTHTQNEINKNIDYNCVRRTLMVIYVWYDCLKNNLKNSKFVLNISKNL